MIFNLFKSGAKKIYSALSKTRKSLGMKLKKFLGRTLDEASIEEIEELLFEADLGVEITEAITNRLRETTKSSSTPPLLDIIREELSNRLEIQSTKQELGAPHIILVVGANGNGKTTFIGKMANKLKAEGKKVLIGAADTFRAAAIDQLQSWAEKVGCEFVKGQPGSDPAAVAFDAVQAAVSRNQDVALIDTAGRLQTKRDLMQELAKIRNSCGKVLPGAPHQTLLVLDATTGQNALEQARIFKEYTPLSGLVLNKLDGTARGGVAVSICKELQIPIEFLGVGEGIEDLEPFDSKSFIEGLIAIDPGGE